MFKTFNKVEIKAPEVTDRSTYKANAAAVMEQMSVGGGHSSLELCVQLKFLKYPSQHAFEKYSRYKLEKMKENRKYETVKNTSNYCNS